VIACRVNAFTSAYVAPAALNLVIIAWRIVGPVQGDVIPALLMIAVNWWLQDSLCIPLLDPFSQCFNWTTNAATFFKYNCVNDYLLPFGSLGFERYGMRIINHLRLFHKYKLCHTSGTEGNDHSHCSLLNFFWNCWSLSTDVVKEYLEVPYGWKSGFRLD
ncbi:MAG: hypothetical protein EZS28_054682, partial [Streblomastix strix]